MRRVLAAGLVVCAGLALLGVAQASVVTGGNVRVSFGGSVTPHRLPRTGSVPIALHVQGAVTPVGDGRPVGLERVTISINRHGVISTAGLPTCPRKKLRARTTEQALALCGDALVGSGHFRAHVDIPEQSPFPSRGRLLAFNTVYHGHPALVAHVYGVHPIPIAQVLPMSLSRSPDGQFGSTISMTMPQISNDWGFVTGFDLTLQRRYKAGGHPRSFLSGSCPAPAGLKEAPFKAARGTFYLNEGRTLTRVVGGSCRVGTEPAG